MGAHRVQTSIYVLGFLCKVEWKRYIMLIWKIILKRGWPLYLYVNCLIYSKKEQVLIFCVLVLNILKSLFYIFTKMLLIYCFMPHSFMFTMLQSYKQFLLLYKSPVAVSQPLFFHRLSVTQFADGSVISLLNPTVSRCLLKKFKHLCLTVTAVGWVYSPHTDRPQSSPRFTLRFLCWPIMPIDNN